MKFYVPIIAALLLITSCKKEQPELTPVNEDCDCAAEVSADFEILELETLPQFDPEGTDTDTIFMEKNVIFRASEEGAAYTWYIGSEILDTKEVGRFFSSSFAGQDIPVTLVVQKQPNYICFPTDDGYDSITKTLHVQNYSALDMTSSYQNGVTLMEGIYRVAQENAIDSFDITIDYIDRSSNPTEQIDIINYDGQGSTVTGIERNGFTRKNYRGLWFENQGTFDNCLEGKFILEKSGRAVFDISHCEEINGEWVTFEQRVVGRKL